MKLQQRCALSVALHLFFQPNGSELRAGIPEAALVLSNDVPIRILLVGEAKEACHLRELLDTEVPNSYLIAHVAQLELAAERLAGDPVDVLLLALGLKQRQGTTFLQAARAVSPDTPMVVLAESEDEVLAVEALRLGVQDFQVRENLDRPALVRAVRYSIERYRLQKNLQNLSLMDDLTGLYNRRGFLALVEQQLRMIQRKGATLLVYLDLDNLKLINDSFGHLEGNRALIVTANLLRASFRQSDIPARMGGDEFCVLMTDAGQDSELQLRKRLQERSDFINALSSWRFRISLSVGIAEVPVVHQPSLEQLLRLADANMYSEKREKQIRGDDPPAFKQPTVA
jgi:diguanylate cyclase (GGDEF)-like protein